MGYLLGNSVRVGVDRRLLQAELAARAARIRRPPRRRFVHIRVDTAMTRFVFTVLLSLSLASGALAGQADYTVGAQDVLTITVYDQPDMSGKFKVEADGTFTFPLIGRVTASGQTLQGDRDRAEEAPVGRLPAQSAGDGRGRDVPEPAHLRDGRSALARQLFADRRHDAHRGARAGRIDHAAGQRRSADRAPEGGRGGRRPGDAEPDATPRSSASTSASCRRGRCRRT